MSLHPAPAPPHEAPYTADALAPADDGRAPDAITADRAAADAPATAPRCPNCAAESARNFCPECGQEMISVSVGLRDLAREFLDDHVGWSTKVPKSLARLFIKPGALTRDFVEGRRVRYLSPLRLYLSLSVAFFLLVASPPSWSQRIEAARGARQAAASQAERAKDVALARARLATARATPGTADSVLRRDSTRLAKAIADSARRRDDSKDTPEAAAARRARADTLLAELARKPPDSTRFKGRMKLTMMRRSAAFIRMSSAEQKELFIGGLTRRMPDVMFVMLPLFALLLKLVMWRRRRFYAEHFVFALHTHAFTFGLLALAIVAPVPHVGLCVVAAATVYYVAAMRRVYGGSVLRNTAKALLLGGVYSMIVGTAATALAGFIFLYG